MSRTILKRLGVATTVFVLLWGIYLYKLVPRAKSPFAKVLDQVDSIVLKQPGKELILFKQTSGWVVLGKREASYPIEDRAIKNLLSSLRGLQLEDEISDRADRAPDFNVDEEHGFHVQLVQSKHIMAQGIFGKQAPDYVHTYFRFPDKPNVYLSRGVSRPDLGSADLNVWRTHQLLDVVEGNIQSVLIEAKGFKSDLVRVSSEAWTCNGKTANLTAVNQLLGTLAHAHVDDFVDPAITPGLAYASLTYGRVIVKTPDRTFDLHVGFENSKLKKYPVALSPESDVGWISESITTTVFQKPTAYIAQNKKTGW